MAVTYDDDIAPAIESKAAKGRIIYDSAAPVPPPAPPSLTAPAVSGAAPSPAPIALPPGPAVRRNPNMNPNALPKSNATPGELVQAAGSGFNSGVMDLAGLPVDAVNKVRELLGGTPDAAPVGGSESLKNASRKVFGTSTVDAQPTAQGADLSGLHTAAGLLGPGEVAKGAGVVEKGVDLLSDAAKAGKGVEGAARASVADPIGTVRGAGYILRPSDSRAAGGPSSGIVREALTNSTGLAKDAGLKNQALSTRLAGEHIGLKDAARITDTDYDKYRSTVPGPVYDATADALSNTTKEGKLVPDTETVGTLNSLAANQNPASALTPKAASNVQRISKKIESGNYTGKDWRTDVSWLRANGARDAADELEAMAERTLSASGNTPQVAAFQQARQQFAQSYDLQGATAKRGQVDAQALAAIDAKYPHLLTGNLKVIATAGRTIPDVTRVPGGGVSDFAASTGHSTGLITGAARIAGSAIKHSIPGMNPLSKGFQTRNFGRVATPTEASYTPTFGERGPGPSPFAPRLDLTPPPGPVTDPTQLGFALTPGRPAAPVLELKPAPGEIGEAPGPHQLGMTLAQGRPMDEQRLNLKPTEGSYDPHQHSLPLKDNAQPKRKKPNTED